MAPRLAIYGATSTALAAAVIGSALHSRANFFAAAVTVGKSSGSLMVLANFALFIVICFGILLKKIFFGQLRPIEYEHLFERLWLFLTESLLALTIFRDDFSAPFAIMYSLLLFLKCFHWITADRVDYMDQIPAPGPPRIFHIRMTSILFLLTLIDILLVTYSLESIAFNGVSSMVLFASEFVILLASVSGTFARYWIGVADLWRARGREDAPSWEQKSMYLFYVDLAVDFVKLLTYLSFFTVILLHYGLPLHILRDVYMTFRSFLSRCSDLVRYRRATRDMDALYPNATPQDMATLGDHTCIICREEMVPQGQEGAPAQADGPNETPKKLACGHIFHFHCLRSWLERQQSCPTCRRDVLRAPAAASTARRTPAPNAPAPPTPIQRPPLRPNATAAEIEEEIRLSRAEAEAAYEALLRPVAPGFGAGPSATSTGLSTQSANPEADLVQTGIWGGPIRPGEFFPARLGACPTGAFRAQRPPNPHAVRPTPTRTTSTPAAAGPSNATTVRPDGFAAMRAHSTMTAESRQGSSRSLAPDGWTTPHSSNPPQVFSSTGSPRSSTELSREIDDVAPTPRATSDVDTVDGSERAAEEPEKRQRRAAAEAAMRRLGLKSSLSASRSPSPATGAVEVPAGGVVSLSAVPSSSSTVPGPAGPRTDVKGKGKAVDSDSDQPAASRPEGLKDPPRVLPYLTSGLSGPHPQANGVDGAVRSFRDIAAGAGLRREWTAQDSTRGLDERMRVLREFDEALWGLMADLTSVKSRWEVEDRLAAGASAIKEDNGTEEQHLV